MIFQDREDAGRQLAQRLTHLRDESPIILGLPRGGVVVAYQVARALSAPLDVVVARKLGAPINPELGIGAIAPGGVRVLDEHVVRMLGVDAADIEEITAREQIELERRLRKYRGNEPALHVTKRTVIVVDDGLATGVTARAAVRSLRQQEPHRLVFAAPVGSSEAADLLEREVDELVLATAPPGFHSVGQFYRRFDQTSDEEVLALLERARHGVSAGMGAPGLGNGNRMGGEKR